jgi:hypothetical protein
MAMKTKVKKSALQVTHIERTCRNFCSQCVNCKTPIACSNITNAHAVLSGHDTTHIINKEGYFHFDIELIPQDT